ncbi:soluble NSF attachment protein 29-like [Drosophila takahashii]|uniref:soluble NSF attachment protein 29-like n=1 Tax=Drosophila takahashii TaxID=29030 RepID=UPI001CF894F0|nr:soluble NSF attachment protein 29-like [Drosophila takahashii]
MADDQFDDVERVKDADDGLLQQIKETEESTISQQGSSNPIEMQDEITSKPSVAAQLVAFAEEKRDIEQRTLESTNRSLGLLYESQELGMATAVELSKQREQVENVTHQLDEMDSKLRINKKRINRLKSVFGSVKNFLSGSKKKQLCVAVLRPVRRASQDSDINIDMEDSPSCRFSPSEFNDNHSVSQQSDDSNNGQKADPLETQIKANLEEMSTNVSVLKKMATDLGGEIESQNELLDNTKNKMDDIDLQIEQQTQELSKLLNK